MKKEIIAGNRYTWQDIVDSLPDRWLGLSDITWGLNEATIESATVKYLDKTKDELAQLMVQGECSPIYTTPDNVLQIGALI
ncbi:MAG: hypothetical protein LBV33_00815 [Lachnospiraceae bacterium]|jgi:hypothetical protein|nr:hypothetical protein [Lachnospiraceae bacterium]